MGKSYEAATLFMLKSAGYESGANNVVKSNDKIASSNKKVAASSAVAGKGMKKATAFISQTGYGLEDFALGFQTGGMQGAMRGASNNLSMMAMAAGGMTGALAALGTVISVTVMPALSAMAQYTTVFDGLKHSIEGFVDSTRNANLGVTLGRQADDTMSRFKELASLSSVTNTISGQRLTNSRTSEDLARAKKDLLAMVRLREDLIQADYKEGKSKNLFHRFVAGISPATQDLMDATFGSDTESMYNNEAEINKSFDKVQRELTQKISRLKTEASAGEGLLERMLKARPDQIANVIGGNAQKVREVFENEMAKGLSLEDQLSRELDMIAQKYTELESSSLNETTNHEDQIKILQALEDAESQDVGIAKSRFADEIQKRDLKIQEAIKGINGNIEKFNLPNLDSIEQEFKRIANEAQKLKETVEKSGMSQEDKARDLNRIEQIEKARRDKASGDGRHKLAGQTKGTQRLGVTYAGSDAVLSSLSDRSDELTVLKKIASNTKKKASLSLEVV